MKKNYILFLILFICANSYAQTIKEPSDFFKTIFKNSDKINSYYTGGNPAYLHNETSDEVLSVKTSYVNEDGEFRRFVDPETNRLYELSFTGKKEIDSLQVFKGSFAVQRIERKNWNRVFTKEYGTWNPFLLGDASAGDAHYNGIVMNAGYSAILFEKLFAGFNFNYSVDQGLKEVFPHPTSEHRDINIKAGFGYLISNDYSIGGFVDVLDNSERIQYQTDQEGINRENILYKYRGYGMPVLYAKKDEERNSFQNKYAGYGTFSAKLSGSLSSAFYFGGGIEHISIADDDSRPVAEGYVKNTFYKGGFNALYNLSAETNIGLSYDFSLDNIWSKNPSYNVLIMENEMPCHNVKAGIDYKLNNKIKIGLEAGIDISKIDYKDYYSVLSWKAEPTKLMINIGASVLLSDKLNFDAFAGYTVCNTKNNSFIINADSINQQYINERKNDIIFYQSGYNQLKVSFIPAYHLGSLGIVKLYLNYDIIKPEKENWIDSAKRQNIDAVLEFRLNVY